MVQETPVRALASQSHGSLSDQEKKICHQILNDFFHGKLANPVQAGIDSAAKFQECLCVMRDIVLHSLGLHKQQQQAESRTLPDSLSEPRHSSGNRMTAEGVYDGRQQPQVEQELSPSSTSRLSSGFGSLLGEGSSEGLEPAEVWGRKDYKSSSSKNSRRQGSRGKKAMVAARQDMADGRRRNRHHKHAWTDNSCSPSTSMSESQQSPASSNTAPNTLSHSTSMRTPLCPSPSSVPSSNYDSAASFESQGSHSHKKKTRSPSYNGKSNLDLRTELGSSQSEFYRRTGQELVESREEEQRLQQQLISANLHLLTQQVR